MLSLLAGALVMAPPPVFAPAPAPVVSSSDGARMLVAERPRGRWGAGASFVVGGGALAGIVVLQVMRDRSYRECMAARIGVSPALSGTFQGLSISGRF